MSAAHVRFETPADLNDQTYEMIKLVRESGRIKKGSNEVTKSAERGHAKMVIMAEDVNPPELLAHIPLICEEKGIPYAYVTSQQYLAAESGLPDGSRTASIAIIEVGSSADEAFAEIVASVEKLKA